MDFCPLIQKKCVKDKCKFWIHISGSHPQTGAHMDMPDCAVRWLPVLLIDNAKEIRQAAAAIESQRNEAVKVAKVFGALAKLGESSERRLGGTTQRGDQGQVG